MKPNVLWATAALLALGTVGLVLAQGAPGQPDAPPSSALPHTPGMNHAGMGHTQARSSAELRSTVPQLRADLTLSLARPYTPDARLPDDYRCFVLDPGLEQDAFISGYEVVPGNARTVHHAILHVALPQQRAEVLARSGGDGQEGWPCFGGTGLRSGAQIDRGQALLSILRNGGLNKAALEEIVQSAGMGGGGLGIGSWTPGSTATLFPEGTGQRLPKGSLLVMQVHYNTAAGRDPDRTQVRLQLERSRALTPLRTFVLAAPVELPCPAPAQGAACQRDTALREGLDKYGPRAGKLPDYLLTFCGKSAADFSGQTPARVVSTCERTLSTDLTAEGVILHMHTRGLSTRLERNPGTREAQTLLEIPRWDFHWQGSYWYQTPIRLNKGDVLRIECVWDNTLEPQPRYVTWGEGTQDEMCLGALTVRD